jgi:hypothetical protein
MIKKLLIASILALPSIANANHNIQLNIYTLDDKPKLVVSYSDDVAYYEKQTIDRTHTRTENKPFTAIEESSWFNLFNNETQYEVITQPVTGVGKLTGQLQIMPSKSDDIVYLKIEAKAIENQMVNTKRKLIHAPEARKESEIALSTWLYIKADQRCSMLTLTMHHKTEICITTNTRT